MTSEDYFYNTPAKTKRYDTLEISHPSFSQVYRICRNCSLAGLTATIEDASNQFFQYYPAEIKRSGQSGDLDQSLSISFGDLGQILPQEIDRVMSDDSGLVYPLVKYRVWRSDDLTAPLEGPELYRIEQISFKKEGSTFDVVAPKLNITGTGQTYDYADIPMLGGF
jgi:hypothetical protein